MSAADTSGQALSQADTPAPGPTWQEQDEILREMWMRNQTPAAIAEKLGRSVAAIMTRAARLGLPRRFAPGRKPGRRPEETRQSATGVSSAAASDAAEAPAAVTPRICLMCLTRFPSAGRHNRICPSCKGSAEYESAARLPELGFTVE